jgi:hypothetical protein
MADLEVSRWKRPTRNRKGQCHGHDSHDNAKGVLTAANYRRRIQRKSPLECQQLMSDHKDTSLAGYEPQL